MLAKVLSGALLGIDAYPVEVEVFMLVADKIVVVKQLLVSFGPCL